MIAATSTSLPGVSRLDVDVQAYLRQGSGTRSGGGWGAGRSVVRMDAVPFLRGELPLSRSSLVPRQSNDIDRECRGSSSSCWPQACTLRTTCSCSAPLGAGVGFPDHHTSLSGRLLRKDQRHRTTSDTSEGLLHRAIPRWQGMDIGSGLGVDLGLWCRRLALAGFALAIVATASSVDVALAESSVDVMQPAQQETVRFGSPELLAKLEAQIKLDLQSDLALAKGNLLSNERGRNLLELAEMYAEIDSTLPPESVHGGSLGKGRVTDLGPDVVAASLPSAAAGLALSGSAALASGAAGAAGVAAAGVLQPAAAALASPAAGLSAKLATVLTQAVHHFGGGGVAGAIGATVVYPLDTVKTKMQAQRKKKEGEGELKYKNDLDCFVKMVKEEGVGSLYSGLGPQLLGVAPEKAVKLTVNEILLSILETFLPGARIWALELVAGGGGGFSQVVFTNPVETVKVKLQTQTQPDGTPPKNTWQVVKELGVKGLYSGSAVTMARDIPASAIFFAGYAFLKQINPDNSLLNGSLAAIPAAIIVTPADVIKTRLTVEPRPGQVPYKNGWDCVQRIIKEEGAAALFKGWGSRVLRVSPQFGITLAIYDLLAK